MFDAALLTLVVVCFALAIAYASLCDGLLGRPHREDVSP